MNLLAHPLFPQKSRFSRIPTKPWYRASKHAWYVEFNGRDNEKAARGTSTS